jgi:phosphatidylinositol-bisphosphatase
MTSEDDFLSSYTEQQLLKREDEFIERVGVTVLCGTWNVNGKMPTESLAPWLSPSGGEPAADVYVVGFQELDLTAGALLLGDETRAGPWETQLRQTLPEHELLVSKQLVGMLICVFVRRELAPHISHVYTDVEPVGIMGIMGNKGGVAVRFAVHDSTLCFVNCHLNAHHANVRRRNQDYRDICDRLRFATLPSEATLWDHEHVFWIGDLNYRIDLPDDHVRSLTARAAWDDLYAADQLRTQQRNGSAFHGWQEAAIRFAPTYKYDTDSENYDTSEKRRAPAWCDRILYRGATLGDTCVQHSYKRHELRSSDHRPVSALFTVRVKRFVAEKKAAVLRDIVETLAKFENDARPDCQLVPQQWELGAVHFGVEKRQQFVLRNNGPGAAQFRFLAKPGSTAPLPPWLRVSPTKAFVAPASECVIEMSVLIDGAAAAQLNMCDSDAQRALSDILVLHLEHGLDFFISVNGAYQSSAFGCTLDYLVCRASPIRAPQTQALGTSDRLLVPKELWLLADRLQRDALEDASLFQQSGDAAQVAQLREWLDTSDDFAAVSADVSIHSVAETLLRFLASLAEPVVPFQHYYEALDAADVETRCRTVLQYIPVVYFRTFHYVTALLKARVVARRQLGGDSVGLQEAARLAALFGPVLVRPSTKSRPSTQAMRRSALFVAHFILPPDWNAAALRQHMVDEIETD